jgi:hypothetical protein
MGDLSAWQLEVAAVVTAIGLGVLSRTPWSRNSAYLQAVNASAAVGLLVAGRFVAGGG